MRRNAMTIGLVEDDPIMGESIAQRLSLEGCKVRWWRSGGEAVARRGERSRDVDLMVCDMRLPDMSGEEVFRSFADAPGAPPFVFITGYGEIDQAVRLMRMGAADFMTKPFVMEDFLNRLRNIARAPCRDKNDGPELGLSAPMRAVEDLILRYAAAELPVLITGETGVGKELAARLIHKSGRRCTEPFIAVNCAAIPADLLESELFGHEKGAFTGAARRHLGYAERAGSGTLFLDEIGDMSPVLQAKLLRLVETRRFTRIGGETEITFAAHIVAATHRDLLAPGSGFRQDLYFRLAVLPAHVPPLRERRDDIPWLMVKLLADATARQNKAVRGFSALAEDAALDHDWPGNVRELRNRIERAVAMAGADWIMPADLFPETAGAAQGAADFVSLAEVREAAERRQIERALALSDRQMGAAAKLLGISRTTLWEKMNRLGLVAEDRSDS